MRKGQITPEETRKKQSLARMGKVPWNKGKKMSYIAWNKGIPLPEEQKRKISIARKGKCLGNTYGLKKGNTLWLGRHHTEESKKKMSITRTGRKHTPEWNKHIKDSLPVGRNHPNYGKNMSGKKNGRWIEDRTKVKKSEKKHLDTQYRCWMLGTKRRDNWKCRLLSDDCKGRLESHHIFNWIEYPELRYILTNGITLCAFHHPRGREEEKRMIPILQELLSVSKE
jgi:hypothetical protein